MNSVPFVQTVTRQRRKTTTSPYSNKPAPGDWTDPDEIDVTGYFGPSSASPIPDPVRSGVIISVSFYCDPADQDVKIGDRLVDGEDTYRVAVKPTAPRNVFTGWQPYKECPVSEALG